MFRIRRIYDVVLPREKDIVEQVQRILREQFSLVSEDEVQAIPDHLHNPIKYRLRTILFAAENRQGSLAGFALMMHSAKPPFCYLDFISVDPRATGGGVGAALYQRLRQEARLLGAIGIFMECLSDEPAICRDQAFIKQNKARMKFYERFGARPVIGTRYETPIREDDPCPPSLMFDDLGTGRPLRRETARQIVRAILERRYSHLCPPKYIKMVVRSFRDEPTRLREPRYIKPEDVRPVATDLAADRRIALVMTDRHRIHHVRERGYVESPARIDAIHERLATTGLFAPLPIRHFSNRHILAVHDADFVDYLHRVCEKIDENKSVYPYVFPLRNATRKPVDLPVRAGYYCIDTFTPLNRRAYDSARRAVDCALTAAQSVLETNRLAYALVRPPGHHAEKRAFGGFCYFNSAAIAAHYLSRHGRVALLDIDYHHGNGSQTIFYDRADVLTVSLHGHPRFAYPYFTGFEDERGEGEGEGFNINFPLPEKLEGELYRSHLKKALKRISDFAPTFLVVAFGLDPAKADPTGSWSLTAPDFESNGRLIGALRLPTVVVQEGGYRIRNLGTNARRFFIGLWKGAFEGRLPAEERPAD